jgi:sialic acid synthase SpsE
MKVAERKMKISIGSYTVSDNNPVCFVAEVGAFYNKDIRMAQDYMDMAAEAGVDFFKTEILHTADVVLANGAKFAYQTASGPVTEDYRAFIERKVVSLEGYEQLFERGRMCGMSMIATVFDDVGIDFLVTQKAAAIKISRNNINHEPLIRYAAQSGLPIIFDLGDVPLWVAQRALHWVQSEGGGAMFNHHPAKNPASASDHNLTLISWLKSCLKTPIGLSCHYRGDEILYASIGAGVNLIEKGIDADPNRSEADLISAASFIELADIVQKCKKCSAAMGDANLVVHEERLDGVRTGIVAKSDINEGEALSLSNIRYAWPPKGISPEYWSIVCGRRIRKAVKSGEPVTWGDLFND